ncbi:pinensin family lanthipeptide [Ekhidna sp.]
MKKKMNLSELKVKSFVTENLVSNAETIIGGGGRIPGSHATNCVTLPEECPGGGGGGGGGASRGCSNNSCADCYTE